MRLNLLGHEDWPLQPTSWPSEGARGRAKKGQRIFQSVYRGHLLLTVHSLALSLCLSVFFAHMWTWTHAPSCLCWQNTIFLHTNERGSYEDLKYFVLLWLSVMQSISEEWELFLKFCSSSFLNILLPGGNHQHWLTMWKGRWKEKFYNTLNSWWAERKPAMVDSVLISVACLKPTGDKCKFLLQYPCHMISGVQGLTWLGGPSLIPDGLDSARVLCFLPIFH
jgi:hypothetical protein